VFLRFLVAMLAAPANATLSLWWARDIISNILVNILSHLSPLYLPVARVSERKARPGQARESFRFDHQQTN
jgi:hypothetical protein